jgi:hypothetical protein
VVIVSSENSDSYTYSDANANPHPSSYTHVNSNIHPLVIPHPHPYTTYDVEQRLAVLVWPVVVIVRLLLLPRHGRGDLFAQGDFVEAGADIRVCVRVLVLELHLRRQILPVVVLTMTMGMAVDILGHSNSDGLGGLSLRLRFSVEPGAFLEHADLLLDSLAVLLQAHLADESKLGVLPRPAALSLDTECLLFFAAFDFGDFFLGADLGRTTFTPPRGFGDGLGRRRAGFGLVFRSLWAATPSLDWRTGVGARVGHAAVHCDVDIYVYVDINVDINPDVVCVVVRVVYVRFTEGR